MQGAQSTQQLLRNGYKGLVRQTLQSQQVSVLLS